MSQLTSAAYISSVRDLQTIVQRTPVGDNTAWARVSESLTHIARHLASWGHLLRKIGSPPNPTTVQEIVNALNDLNIVLYDLDIWLGYQYEQFWRTLQTLLQQAQKQPTWFIAQKILSAYVQELEAQKDRGKRPSYAQRKLLDGERMEAGTGFLFFARDLSDAIQAAISDYPSF